MSSTNCTPEIMVLIPRRNDFESTMISIESCIAQTVPTQVLVLDNESEDDSLDELKKRYKTFENIEFRVNPRNYGRVGNWNAALEVADSYSARWIRFLFSGEELLPDCQAECQKAIGEYPGIGALVHEYIFNRHGRESVSGHDLKGYLDAEQVRYLNYIKGGFMGSIVANVYSMEAVGEIRFNENLVGKTEFDFSILSGRAAYYLPKVLSRSNIERRGTFASAHSLKMVYEDAWVRVKAVDEARPALGPQLVRKATREIFSEQMIRSVEVLGNRDVAWGLAGMLLKVLLKVLRKLGRAARAWLKG